MLEIAFFYYATSINHAIFQIISCHLLTTEANVYAQVSTCGICGGQSDTRTDFSASPQLSLVGIFLLLLHIHLYIMWGRTVAH
jgi:hypothetical protein